MTPVCYLDMDECLVDFVGGALKLHGLNTPKKNLEWELCNQLGFQGREEEFWGAMGEEFWASLDWTEEGKNLLLEVERTFGEDNICLMTKPILTKGCAEGKLEWIRRHAPRYARKVMIGAAKHLTAGPGKVLVDDHEKNTDLFSAHGGHAVLIPRPWNRRKHLTDEKGRYDPVDIQKEIRDAYHSAQTSLLKICRPN